MVARRARHYAGSFSRRKVSPDDCYCILQRFTQTPHHEGKMENDNDLFHTLHERDA